MSSKDYIIHDQPHTLFPLTTTSVLLTHCFDAFQTYAYRQVLDPGQHDHFLPQVHCYASKEKLHLRRTVKLDPVAEVFIYDLIYRNRQTFRPDFVANRRSFGFTLRNGLPILLSEEYERFRAAITEAKNTFRYAARFDISNYFNSLYHHDLVQWFSGSGRSLEDAGWLGQFLRETNAGRSMDCLPQGLHPCKVIGSEFLKFIDNSIRIRSPLLLRLMDDFYLFSDDEGTLVSDFITIQQMLGEKGLSINPQKTQIGVINELDVRREVDRIRLSLLQLRGEVIDVVLYDAFEEFDPDTLEHPLSDEQIAYLLDLLQDPNIDEADADLVLILLRDHGTNVLAHMQQFLERFPSLTRKVYSYCRYVDDLDELSRVVLDFLTNTQHATEDQLYWTTRIAEDYLRQTGRFSNIVSRLYEHPNATDITHAKLLEIPETRFGMPELREERLRTGRSDWVAWAAAVGCRDEQPIQRNHKLVYFAHGGPINSLINDCVRSL